MLDQLIIGERASLDDFEASVMQRKISAPKKKTIKETVPFSNVTYDFSGINGEIYWEERTLEYVFEIIAMTPEELEEKKQAFVSWIMNVNSEELHDPFIKDYHFLATFDSIDFEDEYVEKYTITVIFTAYPYMISNKKKAYTFPLAASEEITVNITNDSSHRITPTFISDVDFVFQMGSTSYGIGTGETMDDSVKLEAGHNTVKIQNATSGSGIVKIEFYEEVF